jgi:hypothetical protein
VPRDLYYSYKNPKTLYHVHPCFVSICVTASPLLGIILPCQLPSILCRILNSSKFQTRILSTCYTIRFPNIFQVGLPQYDGEGRRRPLSSSSKEDPRVLSPELSVA